MVATSVEEKLPEKPLLEHVYDLLETLRKILIAHLAALLVLLVAPAPNELPRSYDPILFYMMNLTNRYMLDFSSNPFAGPLARVFGVDRASVKLIAHGWFDGLTAALTLAALLIIVFLSPLTAYLVYKFVEPGLYSHEKSVLRRYMVFALSLFVCGTAYGFFVLMPLVFAVAVFLARLGGAELLFSIQDFYANILIGSLATGVFFMFPLAILALSKMGLITYEMLSKNWRYVTFVTFAILVVVTPDPTPTSALALGVPFTLLYALSMWLVKRSEKRRRG